MLNQGKIRGRNASGRDTIKYCSGIPGRGGLSLTLLYIRAETYNPSTTPTFLSFGGSAEFYVLESLYPPNSISLKTLDKSPPVKHLSFPTSLTLSLVASISI
ncbi:hypothetical protein OIU85_023684 [Salix viminalis]|uniref:Uncharacterized protein n=1 Tax=Salix viminalis TaxID=40686 RepID=A0A9Q0Z3Z5_SALVM|nr:hypothetical protein OIU85_023684 [Salix viminalis]